jgi:hypothetical protein
VFGSGLAVQNIAGLQAFFVQPKPGCFQKVSVGTSLLVSRRVFCSAETIKSASNFKSEIVLFGETGFSWSRRESSIGEALMHLTTALLDKNGTD